MLLRSILYCCCYIGSLLPAQTFAQSLTNTWTGFPLIHHYADNPAMAKEGVWSITQDHQGILYAGVEGGVVSYDGVNWRMTPVVNKRVTLSLFTDAQGTVFTSSYGDMGYLAPDKQGQLRFISLKDQLPEAERDLQDVWFGHATSEAVYFQPLNRLFEWKQGKMKVIRPEFALYRSAILSDTYIARQPRVGLMQYKRDTLSLIAGTETCGKKSLAAMIPLSNSQQAIEQQKILFIGRSEGIFLYESGKTRRISVDSEAQLMAAKPYNAVKLSDQVFVIGTFLDGLFFYDRNGKLLQHISQEEGLGGSTVMALFFDGKHTLWVGLENGLSRVDIGSPYSLFDLRNGLEGKTRDILPYRDQLLVSNHKGVFSLSNKQTQNHKSVFRLYRNFTSQSWAMLLVGGQIVVASTDGIAWLNPPGRLDFEMITDSRHYHMASSKKVPSRVFAASERKVLSIRYEKEKQRWVNEGELISLDPHIHQLLVCPSNYLWIRADSGLFRLHMEEKHDSIRLLKQQEMGEASGLLAPAISCFIHNSQMYVSTALGTFVYNKQERRFIKLETQIVSLSNHKLSGPFHRTATAKGQVWGWLTSPPGMYQYQATQPSSGNWTPLPFQWRYPLDGYIGFKPIVNPKGTTELWISAPYGMVHYDPTMHVDTSGTFSTLIRKLSILPDSVLFNGQQLPASAGEKRRDLAIHASVDALRFEYAAPWFMDEWHLRYQYFLEGFEDKWSAWTAETQKDYTNLPAGNFVFHVRARTPNGKISRGAKLTFVILTPWYSSLWAKLLYVLLGLAFLYGIVRSRVWYLEKQKRELEARIKRRTETIRQQAEQLQELDKSKSRFFANISHEFRTPLTLILGQNEQLLAEVKDPKLKRRFSMIDKNGKRLLSLVNQVLALSKLEAGSLQLRKTPIALIPFLKNLLFSFESLADQKHIQLNFFSNQAAITANIDPERLERVFFNLIANALKYTPESGQVDMEVHAQNGQLQIIVRDTGRGIPEKDVPFIFDRFYQSTHSEHDSNPGTGIGLALARELVQLHGGTIQVESMEGTGSSFLVEIPWEGQIAESVAEFTHASSSPPERSASVSLPVSAPSAMSANGTKLRLLIVEDNPDVRTFLKEQVLGFGYEVVEAADGVAGLQLAQQHIPDLIISDVMMPRMDGFSFARNIREDVRTSHIPLILLTAKASEDSRIQGLQIGVDDYLTKPFNKKELEVRIRNLIQLRQQLQKRFQSATHIQPTEVSVVPMDQQFIKKILQYIEKNLSNEQFSVEELSQFASMSVSHLNRKLNALVGQSAGKLIRSVKMQRAADLLKQDAGTISDIAYQLGFSDPTHFSRSFKKQFGVSPSRFKNA